MKQLLHILCIILIVYCSSLDGMENTISIDAIILRLPQEMIVKIIGYCLPRDKNKLMKVSKTFYLYLKNRELILLANPSTVSVKDKIKDLFKYTYINNIKMMEFLLENGVDVNCKNILGLTPFHVASDRMNEKAIQLLIDYGADKDESKPYFLEFQKAVYKGDAESVKTLLLSQNQNFCTKNSTSPLGIASYEGHINIVKLLLADFEKGVHCTDLYGWTPLCYACCNNHFEIVQLFLSVKADVNHVTNSKWSPLCFAVCNGNIELVQLLINNGAKIDNILKPSGYGWEHTNLPMNSDMPLEIAKKRGYTDIVELLQKHFEPKVIKENIELTDNTKIDHIAVKEPLQEQLQHNAIEEKTELLPTTEKNDAIVIKKERKKKKEKCVIQ